MICAIIDVGSNTIRMSVYEAEEGRFSVLFSKKETAGLAGYINKRVMSEEGIAEATRVLEGFRKALLYTKADELHVFATASLRNIDNSEYAISKISADTGFEIELVSGQNEAELSFAGAVCETPFDNGFLFDLGGGSTEIVGFENRKPDFVTSLEIGSLNLFKNHVERILPKKSEMDSIGEAIDKIFDSAELPDDKKPLLVGVGGTARSLGKIMNAVGKHSKDNKNFSISELNRTVEILEARDEKARDLILNKCPDRVHTIIPGAILVRSLAKKLESQSLHISSYGVREGYLWKKVMKNTI